MPLPSFASRIALATSLILSATACTALFDSDGVITNRHMLSGRTASQGGPTLGASESSVPLKDAYFAPLKSQLERHLGVIAALTEGLWLYANGSAVQWQNGKRTLKTNSALIPNFSFRDAAKDIRTLCQNETFGSQIFPEDPWDDEKDKNGIKNNSGPCFDIEEFDRIGDSFHKLNFSFRSVDFAWRSTEDGPALEMKTRFEVTEDQSGGTAFVGNIHWSHQTFTTLIKPKYCGHCSQEPCQNGNRPVFSDGIATTDLAPVDLEILSVESSGDLKITNPACYFWMACWFVADATNAKVIHGLQNGVTGMWRGAMELLLNPINLASPIDITQVNAAIAATTETCRNQPEADPLCAVDEVIRNDFIRLLGARGTLDLGQSDFRINQPGGGSAVGRLGFPGGAYGPNTFTAFSHGAELQTARVETGRALEFCRSLVCEGNPGAEGCTFCRACDAFPALCQNVPALVELPANPMDDPFVIPALPALQWLVQGSVGTSSAVRNWFQAPFAADYPRRFGKSFSAKSNGSVVLRAGSASADRDGDGVPNICDGCPGIPDQDHVPIDFDGDGVYDTCDNCPFEHDATQSNSNGESEIVLGLATQGVASSGIGDRCDPAPTPITTIKDSEGVVSRSGPFSVVLTTRNKFRVRGIQQNEQAQTVRTGFRFCPCAEGTNDSFRARLACADFSNCKLADHSLYSAPGSPWRPMSMVYPIGSGVTVNRAGEGFLSYSEAGSIALPASPTCGAIDGVPLSGAPQAGVVWVHAVGPTNGNFVADLRNRSNDYVSGNLFGSQQTIRQEIPLIDWTRFIRVIRGAVDPVPWLSQDSIIGLARDNTPWIRSVNGAYAMPNGFGAAAVAALAQPGVRWFAASEPERFLPEQGLAYVGLTNGPSGIQIASKLLLTGSQIDVLNTPVLLSASGSAPTPVLSSYFGTHSITESKLWLFGKGAGGTELWLHDFELQQWEQIPDTIALGDPLALTYDAEAREVYLLDSAVVGFLPHVRLLRVRTDSIQVVAAWPKLLFNVSYELATDGANGLYVAASTSVPQAHAVARFTRGALTWQPASFAAGFGKVEQDGLMVSDVGISLIVRNGSSSSQVSYTPTKMAPLGAAELRRCF